jgi:hypothetical protein
MVTSNSTGGLLWGGGGGARLVSLTAPVRSGAALGQDGAAVRTGGSRLLLALLAAGALAAGATGAVVLRDDAAPVTQTAPAPRAPLPDPAAAPDRGSLLP